MCTVSDAMHIDSYERRLHLVCKTREAATLIALNRGISAKAITSVRPCGAQTGRCYVLTYRTDDTRKAARMTTTSKPNHTWVAKVERAEVERAMLIENRLEALSQKRLGASWLRRLERAGR